MKFAGISGQVHSLTGLISRMDALGAVIKAAPKAERDALALAMEAYAKDFPHGHYEYLWAVGAQSPMLLYHLIHTIEAAAADDGPTRVPGPTFSPPEADANRQARPTESATEGRSFRHPLPQAFGRSGT